LLRCNWTGAAFCSVQPLPALTLATSLLPAAGRGCRIGPGNSNPESLTDPGTFEAFLETIAGMNRSADFVQMLDAAIARAHVSEAGRKRGQQTQALGKSRGASQPTSTSTAIGKASRTRPA
jgi:hypothetical protein